MKLELLTKMHCPYCNGAFSVVKSLRSGGERIEFGLIECRCFRFPIVDGVLLLSMAKGYGGAEEALLPYVPLQVAAITFLEQNDVEGLLAWVRRHAPFAAELIERAGGSYLEIATSRQATLEAESRRFLADQHRYEVVGVEEEGRSRGRAAARWLRWPRQAAALVDPDAMYDQLRDYYFARFISPRVNSSALMLAALPLGSSVLSLCCGHGVFENLLVADGRSEQVVSIDAQFINLLITRRFTNPDGDYICHDVQYPLPFDDGSFDAVLSSTCLPEIPAQASFVREAVRVTHAAGWALFDSVWNTELGVQRIDATRYYRFCQNFFGALDDYVQFFDECAGADREVGLDVPGAPSRYMAGPSWCFGSERNERLRARDDRELNFLVVGRGTHEFVTPAPSWLSAARLAVSPAFRARREAGRVLLERRSTFDSLLPHFAPAGFAGYPQSLGIDLEALDQTRLLEYFADAVLTVLPLRFGGGYAPIGAS